MYFRLASAFVFLFVCLSTGAMAQRLTPNVENGHKRHVVDIYIPQDRAEKILPVMFWITEVGGKQGTSATSH